MNREFKSIEDVIRHSASFALHDVDELGRLANASHFNAEKFTFLAYKKIFTEIRTGLTGLFEYIQFRYPDSMSLTLHKALETSNLTFNPGKSISEIANEISGKVSENAHNIVDCFINPISNTMSFYNGIKDFTIDVAIRESGEISEFYIYNPVQDNMLHYSKLNGISLNKYKIRLPDIASTATARIGCVGSYDIDFNYKSFEFTHCYNNLSTCVLDFLSGKVDFIFTNRVNSEVCDELISLCIQYGCVILNLGTLEIVNNAPENSNAFVIGMRKNITIVQDSFSRARNS